MKSESDADGPGEAGRGDITKCTGEFTLKFWLWGISKVCLQNKYLLRKKFTGETDSTLNSHSLWPSLTHTCVQSRFSWVRLCDPKHYSPPDSSVHGILQARILEWVATPSSRGSSQLINILGTWQYFSILEFILILFDIQVTNTTIFPQNKLKIIFKILSL